MDSKLEPRLNKSKKENSNKINRRTILSQLGIAASATSFSGVVSATTKKDEKYIHIPDGRRVPTSKVRHEPSPKKGIKPEDVKRDLPKNSESTVRATNEPGTNVHKWLSYSRDRFWNGSYSSLQADFVVPDEPLGRDSTNHPNVFYFPALQNCFNLDCFGGRNIILQPVLQWNWQDFDTGEGYPDEWAISAWWLDDNNMVYGDIIPVSPGDRLWGYIDYNFSGGKWYIEIYNYDTGQYSDLTTPDFSSYTFDRSFMTLEAAGFDTTDCKQLPGDCTFESIYFEDMNGNPTQAEWSTESNDTGCGTYAEVINSSKVKIYGSAYL